MYLKINNKKIEIKECKTLKEKWKSLRFILVTIDYGIKIANQRIWSTYYFCQRVDILITDKEEKIIKKIENVKSEKRKILWKKYNIYYLPLNTVKHLKIGDKLILTEKDH